MHVDIAGNDMCLTLTQHNVMKIAQTTGGSRTLPVDSISGLQISQNTLVDIQLITVLLSNQCDIVVQNKKSHPITLSAFNPMGGSAKLRVVWMNCLADNACKMAIAKKLVAAKWHSQRHTIARLNGNNVTMDTLAVLSPTNPFDNTELSITSLLGIEGALSVKYFAALKQYLPPWCHFDKRRRRPATDPFNALISLTYTLATDVITRTLIEAGFDPIFGALHTPDGYRPSLSCDLIEPYRAYLDYWVITQCLPQLTESHFNYVNEDGSCKLTKEGKQIYYQQWGKKRKTFKQGLAAKILMLKKRMINNA
ncbi:CRISPR-associated endonuclease Cas1 [Alteromonas ponticola]|uniref:CRISPR-associated endonuclease Cas1 n=1 Tax=Alteromonas aquimaris TaxID=2998417 RepID=A0ABT3PA16_9ALTE|nr:CRISPR-associated endonuclease Cas1 [Alteromonas aquimaris]MCW8109593.1 CRISPR-associated endonuclease Cas1 [Alteromonas aquimaris]